MRNLVCLCSKYFCLFCGLFLLFFAFSPLQIRAAQRNDLQYYGDRWHTRVNSRYYNGNSLRYIELEYEVDQFACCFLMYYSGSQKPGLVIYSPFETFYQIRRIAVDTSGLQSSGLAETRFSIGTLNSSFQIDGVTFYYNVYLWESDSLSGYSDLPVICADSWEDGIRVMQSGIDQWYADQKGGEISADVSVDLSSVEQLLQDGNRNLVSIGGTTESIEEKMIVSDNFSAEDSENIKSIRIFISCVLLMLVASTFRASLKQWRKNTVK